MKPYLLVFDYLTSHKTDMNRTELACCRKNITNIPGGLTRFL